MNNLAQHLLVVDDEPKIRLLLTKYLSQEGYIVDAVNDGLVMDDYLSKHHVDLVILDLMLPGEDGLSIGRRLRETQNMPIIILSARSEELDKIVGLEMGADDYLSKPFNPRELLARIRSVLRRTMQSKATVNNANNAILTFGSYCLDIERHELTCNDQTIPITSGEFSLLKIFLEHSGKVLSRDRLLEITKGYTHSSIDRSIDVCVGRVRRKIEPDPSNPVYLRTIRGVGYLFSKEGAQ